MKRLLQTLTTWSLLMGIGSATPALAYFSTLDTADLLGPDHYRLGLEPQIFLSQRNGANVIGHFDLGASESGDLKFLLGTGSTSFQGGAFYKFVPIPDYKSQPGIGGFIGLLYANDGTSSLSFRFHPLISKRFTSQDAGTWTPYLSVPFGITAADTTTYPVQLEVGTSWRPSALKHMDFWTELGFNLNAAFSYLSLGLTMPFGEGQPPQFD